MFWKKALLFVLIALLAVSGASCSRGKKDKSLEFKGGLAAKVGDYRITEDQLRERYDALPDQQKKDFNGVEGQANFADQIIEQHLLYQAALDAKIDKDEGVKDRLKWLTMNVLIGEYYMKEISDKITVDDVEIADYYRTHPEEFNQAPVMRAQYAFTTDSLKAVRWSNRLLKGESLSKIAKEESEDPTTAPEDGIMGYFNPGGYIKGVGYSEAFSKAVEKLEPNTISPIIHFEKGFAIVKVLERNPGRTQTLKEAQALIKEKVHAKKAQEAYKREIEKLKKKYPSENFVREKLEKTTRTPEELWEMAQLEQDPRARIQYYRDIVNRYPTHKNAAQALFMIGFVYAEELNDVNWARRTFEELLEKYPQSEMVESAKWMMENLKTGHPKIKSYENMKKQMEADKVQKAGGTK